MNDGRMQSILEDWFKARDTTPSDVGGSARQVASRTPAPRLLEVWSTFRPGVALGPTPIQALLR